METFDTAHIITAKTKDGSIQMISCEGGLFIKASKLPEPHNVAADIIQTVTTPIKFQMALN